MTYWQRRLQNPLHKAYNENEQATRQWLSVYQQASKDIKAEIFDTYQKLNIEKPLISDFYRYNNLQKIEKQINDSILQLGTKEVDYTKQSLQHATLIGSQAAADVLNTNVLNKSAIDELIKRPWHDANFSDRIWKNKAQLINSLKSELTNGIIQGKSIYEVANTIDGRLDVGRSQTQRLVRTEYMHALNQGQIESYRAKGYTKLKWVATMDDKTSEICRKRNGKEYDIDRLPDIPAHPNCRCTMVPVIDMAAAEKRGDEIRKLKDKSQKQIEYLSRTNMKEKVGNKNYNNFIETLNATNDSRIKQLFNKLGDQLEFTDISDGKSYSSGNKIHLNEKAFKGTATVKPLQKVFHELGHSFDSLGTKVLDSDFNHVSEIPSYKLKKAINDDLLKLFNSDLKLANGENYQKVKNLKKLSIFQQSDIVRKYKKLAEENPYKYSSLSDMMESTGGFIEGPLGSGHGLKYWKSSGKQETEFFAHMLEAVANDESRKMMYELFPTASKKWEKMLDDILKN